MKCVFGPLVCCVALSLSLSAFGDETYPPKLVVYSEAEIRLEPDYIEWVVDIRTRDKAPKIARDVNNTIYESLLEIADKAGIDEEDIRSGEPAYEQEFRQPDDGKPNIERYTGTEVYRRVTLIMRDMDEFDEMLDAVHPLGVFYAARRKSSQYDAAVRRVKLQALKNARADAVDQAAALGQEIGKAIDVDVSLYGGGGEGGLFGPPPKPIESDSEAAGPDGKIHITAYADVSFRLE